MPSEWGAAKVTHIRIEGLRPGDSEEDRPERE